MTVEKAAALAVWHAQLQAMDSADVDALRECLTADMILVHMTGHVQPMRQWLDGIRRRTFVYHRLEERTVSVTHLDARTAHLVGHIVTGITDDGSGQAWPLRMDQEYVLVDGGWRCRVSRVTLG